MPKAAPPHRKAAKPKRGRPWKNTPATLERALSAAREGLPLRFCAGLAGVSYQSLNEYRKSDSDFDQRLETALSEGVASKFRAILKAGYGNDGVPPKWEALAWALERAHCAEFSRPEIQLHQLNTQINQVNQTIVITAEQASHLRSRNAAIDKELDEIARAHEAKQKQLNGSSEAREFGGLVREVESSAGSLVPKTDAITLPSVKQRTASWWGQLTGGDGSRSLTAPAADYVLKTIATDCVGGARAGGLKVSWDSETPTLADLWSAINEAAGPAGWQKLVERGSLHPQQAPPGSPGRGASA
jgi:hypothetical protein